MANTKQSLRSIQLVDFMRLQNIVIEMLFTLLMNMKDFSHLRHNYTVVILASQSSFVTRSGAKETLIKFKVSIIRKTEAQRFGSDVIKSFRRLEFLRRFLSR